MSNIGQIGGGGAADQQRRQYMQRLGTNRPGMSFSMDGEDAHGSRMSMLEGGFFGPVYGNNNIGESPDNWGQRGLDNNFAGTFGSVNPAIQQWNQQNARRSPNYGGFNSNGGVGNQQYGPPQQGPGGGGQQRPGGQMTSSFSGTGAGQTSGGTQHNAQQNNYGWGGQQRRGAEANVGAPDLGTVSELMRWASQVPGGMQQLQSMGMMPEISSTQYGGSNNGSLQTRSGIGSGSPFGGMNRLMNNTGQAATNNPMTSRPPMQSFGNGGIGMGGGRQDGLGSSFGTLIGGGQQQGGFEMNLQNTIQQMLQNPTGYTPGQQAQMRTRAGDAAAGQQDINAQRIREDAVRRGAYGSAGGDADIRDQLNRSNAQGAADQQRAVQDVDFGLADLGRQGRQGAAALGTGLLGEQFKNQNSIRELVMMLEALKSSMGGQGGLSMILGGGNT